jgi:nucleoside-diphosphate-sugar epimerase
LVSVKDKPILLLLGGSGFIGKHLAERLSQAYQVVPLSHKSGTLNEIEGLKVEIVVNAAASPMNASQMIARDANYTWPHNVLMTLLFSNPNLVWFQLASYFELQIGYGRSDPYTKEKANFTKALMDLERSSKLNISIIFLPHVFGHGERPERLFSSIRKSVSTDSVLKLSSGKQMLPILSVQSTVDLIFELIKQNPLDRQQSVCSASPYWYGTVRDLIREISHEVNPQLFEFDAEKKSTDEGMPKVDFPNPIFIKEPKVAGVWGYISNSYI